MRQFFALTTCVVLAGLAVLQVCVALGAPWGRYVWGGQHEVLPMGLRIGSGVSILLYGVFALVYLENAGVVRRFGWLRKRTALWVVTLYMTTGVALNAISRSADERMVMVPVALTLAACGFAILFGRDPIPKR